MTGITKGIITRAVFFLCFSMTIHSCKTDDVSPTPPPITDHYFHVPDKAFGEYLTYLGAGGATRIGDPASDTVEYYIDTTIAPQLTGALNLSKASSFITRLQNAGVFTASVKIVDFDGLQYFTNIDSLTITSNEATALDMTPFKKISFVVLNNNFIGSLNLTQCPLLARLEYNGSSKATDEQKLKTIDLSQNIQLVYLSLKSQLLNSIDLTHNLGLNQYIDLSSNPGSPITIPAVIYDQVPSANRTGVKRGN